MVVRFVTILIEVNCKFKMTDYVGKVE